MAQLSAATHSYQCVLYFRLSKHWYGCHCLGFTTCAQILMHATAHGGCMDDHAFQSDALPIALSPFASYLSASLQQAWVFKKIPQCNSKHFSEHSFNFIAQPHLSECHCLPVCGIFLLSPNSKLSSRPSCLDIGLSTNLRWTISTSTGYIIYVAFFLFGNVWNGRLLFLGIPRIGWNIIV